MEFKIYIYTRNLTQYHFLFKGNTRAYFKIALALSGMDVLEIKDCVDSLPSRITSGSNPA